MPDVLAARDRAAGQRAVAAWVASLGEAPPCSPWVQTPKARFMPRLAWLSDRKLLGKDLSARLLQIYARRPNVDEQFYVASVPNVGNPEFRNEPDYAALKVPDAG